MKVIITKHCYCVQVIFYFTILYTDELEVEKTRPGQADDFERKVNRKLNREK